ncbi:MAG TPA: TadE family protein [Caulobacteraceae bacterium]
MEFALVVPVFFGMVFLLLNICVALWAEAALNFAVDQAARCMSVQPGVCDNVTDAVKQHPYIGPNVSPAFRQAVGASCGNNVSATATYVIDLGLGSLPLNLSASSCFPVQD